MINTSQESLVDSVRELTYGIGATAGIDSIGGQDGHDLIDSIRPGGTVLSIGLLSGIQIDWAKVYDKNSNITVKPYWLRRWIEGVSDMQWHKTFENISNLLKEKKLIIETARELFGLLEYKKAIQSAEYHGQKGKVVFAPSLFK